MFILKIYMKWENLSLVPQSFHYELTEETHVEVQTQIYSWSDTVERTPVCSQTKITGSGRNFERTTVWTMVWSRSDQWSIWSQKSEPWSGDALISGKFDLKSLIIGEFERTWVWAEANLSALGSDKDHSERKIVWSWPLRKQLSLIIVWSRSGQWSEFESGKRPGDGLIRTPSVWKVLSKIQSVWKVWSEVPLVWKFWSGVFLVCKVWSEVFLVWRVWSEESLGLVLNLER